MDRLGHLDAHVYVWRNEEIKMFGLCQVNVRVFTHRSLMIGRHVCIEYLL